MIVFAYRQKSRISLETEITMNRVYFFLHCSLPKQTLLIITFAHKKQGWGVCYVREIHGSLIQLPLSITSRHRLWRSHNTYQGNQIIYAYPGFILVLSIGTVSYPHLVFEYSNSNLICTLEYVVDLSLKLNKRNLHICSLGYRYTQGVITA